MTGAMIRYCKVLKSEFGNIGQFFFTVNKSPETAKPTVLPKKKH